MGAVTKVDARPNTEGAVWVVVGAGGSRPTLEAGDAGEGADAVRLFIICDTGETVLTVGRVGHTELSQPRDRAPVRVPTDAAAAEHTFGTIVRGASHGPTDALGAVVPRQARDAFAGSSAATVGTARVWWAIPVLGAVPDGHTAVVMAVITAGAISGGFTVFEWLCWRQNLDDDRLGVGAAVAVPAGDVDVVDALRVRSWPKAQEVSAAAKGSQAAVRQPWRKTDRGVSAVRIDDVDENVGTRSRLSDNSLG